MVKSSVNYTGLSSRTKVSEATGIPLLGIGVDRTDPLSIMWRQVAVMRGRVTISTKFKLPKLPSEIRVIIFARGPGPFSCRISPVIASLCLFHIDGVALSSSPYQMQVFMHLSAQRISFPSLQPSSETRHVGIASGMPERQQWGKVVIDHFARLVLDILFAIDFREQTS
ncbi:unnamed protein product [Litomosoides sigmodontis]|uniref:Uncharacterized protein n=1 Tax=Litomosoides sigmodontis TaxID=42156 RepID=A0A3P6TK63_LITSI|nr:unnamed protein product [Litomosoides sigmodontis]